MKWTLPHVLAATLVLPAMLSAQSPTTPPSADALAAKVRADLAVARRLPPALDRMVTPVVDRVWDGFDTTEAMAQVRFMDQYWRLAGNEGFDKSIDRVKARLIEAGFVELPARPTAPITTPSLWIEPAATPSLGWDQSVATLAIVRDGQPEQVVISRAKERLALEINSFSTAPGGVTAPLIDVGRGSAAGDYDGKDVKGAVVIGTASAGQLFTQAVVNRGALGVVSMAPLPGYLDKNPDILQWGSIAYDEAHKGFGFRATERAAAALKAAIAEGNAHVRAEIVTSFARKPERTLSAEIPGAIAPNERIVIAAHVQEPGANDNASGTATNMELARALVMGVKAGTIPKPGRTLTFLWVNEISGSRRWLTEHPDDKAGVRYMFSMDMTGEDISKTGGHFLIERWPDPGAVWARPWDPHTEWGASRVNPDSLKGDLINDLHMAICERVAVKSLAAIKRPWDVRSNPYEGGSDHTQFGSAGIPSVLDWHFTDRFYHTNQDTFEKTSPEEMRNVGTSVATTAWLMASATAATASNVAELIKTVGDARVAIETREGAIARDGVKPDENATIVAAWKKWYDEAATSVNRLIVKPASAVVGNPSGLSSLPGLLSLATVPTVQCDQVEIPAIPLTPLNVLWAVDDRFWCNCESHPFGHKEIRERTLVDRSAPRSTDPLVRLAAARAMAHLGQWNAALPELLRDVNAQVRAEAANAIAQADIGTQSIDRLGLLRSALIANESRRPATVEQGDRGDAAATAILDAMLRLPEADRAVAEFVATNVNVLRPAPRILGAIKGLEFWTRTHRGATLNEQTLINIRGITALGRTELGRPPGAADVPRDPASPVEQHARIRRLAIQTLQNLSDKTPDVIIAAANDGDWQVRRVATIMLASLALTGPDRDPRAEAAFDGRFKDPDLHVRIEAVKVAARLVRTTGDCGPMSIALDDNDAPVVIQALDSLPDTCRDLSPRVSGLASALAKTGSQTAWPVALHALTALSRIDSPKAAEIIAKRDVQTHAEWQVRAGVAAVAGTTRNEGLITQLFADPTPNVRTAALAAFDAMGSALIYPSAIDALRSTEPQLVREAARRLKGAPHTNATADALLESLKRLSAQGNDTSRDARLAIIDRLTEQAPVQRTGVLQGYLRDFDPEIATATRKLLTTLVPGTEFIADPQTRRPQQAEMNALPSLPSRATLVMADGSRVELDLLVDAAPMSVARFVQLARAGHYDGLTFHRVVANFVVQGGSPDANEYSGDARFMRDELGREPHLRGSVGISTRGRDTGDGQIFIDLVDLPRLDHDYTVFARVRTGMDAVDHWLEGAVIRSVVF
jgi:cyclophilin family peptidyl-prolyl cis-trans isomerase/HEAT repeat protein